MRGYWSASVKTIRRVRDRIPPILYWVSSVSGLLPVAEGHCLPNAIAPTSVYLRGEVTLGRPGVLLPAFTHHLATFDERIALGWSPLCCTWPHPALTRGAAHLAVSVGKLTPRPVLKAARGGLTETANPPSLHPGPAREECGEVPLARNAPATPGSQQLSGRSSPTSELARAIPEAVLYYTRGRKVRPAV